MLLFAKGSPEEKMTPGDLRSGLHMALEQLGIRKRVLAIPPDFTRFHSRAGELTRYTFEYYGDRLTDVLPALGTHSPMTKSQLSEMFEGIPIHIFREHDWRRGFQTLGTVPAEFIREISDHKVDFDWPAQVSTWVADGSHDLILSIGQVVPHEVSGMANFNKNIFVGTGGSEGINKSHFLGAAYGMEKIMGRVDNPVRRVLNYASEHYTRHLPIVYVLTVIGKDEDGGYAVRGLFIGDDPECFERASALSLQVNFEMLEKPLQKIVVYLDPREFKSTWLGNKSIYRTRMAIADGGELIVLAPGVREFGEDGQIDRLIRKYGYVGTPDILRFVEEQEELKQNLSAAAHLIHGSSEGRFRITYCPGHLTREEVGQVGFQFADLKVMSDRYNPSKLIDGFNVMPDGETIFYISNPAIGLWAYRARFE